MARMNWDAENRRSRMRKWYADNYLNFIDLEEPPPGDDQWDLWSKRQVRRSIRRVTETASERALHSETSEGQIFGLIETAEEQIVRGDEAGARELLSSALSIIQQSRTGSLERATSQAVLDCVSLMWAMTELKNEDSS